MPKSLLLSLSRVPPTALSRERRPATPATDSEGRETYFIKCHGVSIHVRHRCNAITLLYKCMSPKMYPSTGIYAAARVH